MNDFRNLLVWHKAHALAIAVHRATVAFPGHERFGLTAQLRRSAIAVPANIAEGCGRHTRRDEAHFLQIAFASACELEAELLMARDLGYLAADHHEGLDKGVEEVQKMLNALARRTWVRAGGSR